MADVMPDGTTQAVLGLAVVAAICFGSAHPASSFDAPYYDGAYHGGPYHVVGFGDGDLTGRRPYWGGPYFVSCPGKIDPLRRTAPRIQAAGLRSTSPSALATTAL